MQVNRVVKVILSIVLVFCMCFSTLQSAGAFFKGSFVDLMFFEESESELGKFSGVAIFAVIVDKPNLSGERLFVTSVIFRIVSSFLSGLVGDTFSEYILKNVCSFQEPFRVCREVKGYYEIEYLGKKGYILKTSVSLIETQQVEMTRSRLDIYSGKSKELTLKDESNFSKFKWSSGNSNIAYYDAKNKKVVAKNSGTTTIIGVYGDKCAYCTVTVIKKWTKNFDAVAVENSEFRIGPADYERSRFDVSKSTNISVLGNVGNWLYVRCRYKQTDYYGYVYYNGKNLTTGTSDSTKGDMLYYATLGWTFPMKDANCNNISSPYGPRKTNPVLHVGVDIVNAIPGAIYGKESIAVCNGTVVSSGYDEDGMGYYVSIETNTVDPVTNKKLTIVYMHLCRFTDDYPQPPRQSKVEKGDVIGLVGNTGNSRGYHLHFDVNNEGKLYSSSQQGYAFKFSINPIYFFISKEVVLQECTSPNGLYWAGIEGEYV